MTNGVEQRRYALLEPHIVLNFAALAVLSGILGNASWDLVKAVAKRTASRYALLSTTGAVRAPTVDDELLERLNQHCRNFIEGLSGMEPKVRAAVIEEVVVHAMTDYLMNNPSAQARMAAMSSMEDVAAVLPDLMRNAAAERAAKSRPTAADFQDLWEDHERIELLPGYLRSTDA